jgi:hypothetical protein
MMLQLGLLLMLMMALMTLPVADEASSIITNSGNQFSCRGR